MTQTCFTCCRFLRFVIGLQCDKMLHYACSLPSAYMHLAILLQFLLGQHFVFVRRKRTLSNKTSELWIVGTVISSIISSITQSIDTHIKHSHEAAREQSPPQCIAVLAWKAGPVLLCFRTLVACAVSRSNILLEASEVCNSQ